MNGEEVGGICRFLLELLSKLKDVIIHRARTRVILIAPDFIQKFVTRYDAFSILNHEFQDFKLLCRHRDGLAGAGELHAREVYADLIERKALLVGHTRGTPQRGAGSRKKFARRKRLGNVIVSSKFK